MSINKNFLLVIISLLFSQCKFEIDPGIFTGNIPIQGTVLDMTSGMPVEGASMKIWFEDNSSDSIILHTDESGYYETEKINLNGDRRIMVKASKEPDYESVTFNGLDFTDAGSPGSISGGVQADKWVVNFKLYRLEIKFRIIPDTLRYLIPYETDPHGFSWQQLTILNTGTSPFTYTINYPEKWIYVDPYSVSSDPVQVNEFEILKIGVDKTMLLPGNDTGSVEITIGDKPPYIIPVYVTVY